ncbi:MAG: ABC transporter substrate-binding protein [Gammaproteobacteria bacterium]|nr:ABC transporter substrate-binding protein [Gammaproteobacteria bacterium]
MHELRRIHQAKSSKKCVSGFFKHVLHRPLFIIAISMLLLSACTGTAPRPDKPSTQLEQRAFNAVQAENFDDAAQLYQELAAASNDEGLKFEWLIKSAQSYFKANQNDLSAEVLAKLDINRLTTQQLLQRQILVAELAIEQRDYERGQIALNFDIPEQTDTATRIKIHKLRIVIANALNQRINAAKSHVALAPLLSNQQIKHFNQQTLWQLLQSAPLEDLEMAQSKAFDNDTLGWLQLAIITKRPAQQASRSLNEWLQFFPSHPADQLIVDSVLARQNYAAYRPASIALLLPLNGPLSNAAKAIRDGFLAAYYQGDHSSTPSIRIYDVTNADGQVRDDVYTVYQNAVNEGAEFVIGPLSKNAIDSLAFRSDLSTPLLALNYISGERQPNDLVFQFGLSPEDEARQVAERAWQDGHRQAIALTPEGDWGERMQTAFADHWESLGGILVESRQYDANSSDFSRPLRSMLQLNLSQTRKRSLQQQMGLELHFEPRRRHDADFVFLAAFPRQGRLLKPQLKFHRASNLPVYASSHIFTGTIDAEADRDINDVIFCDTLWTIDPASSALRQQVTSLWPQNSQYQIRLYALGADTFQLIPHINELQQSEYYAYEGQTGILSMDNQRRLRRQLSWAKINNGIPVKLASPEVTTTPLITP